MQYGLRTLLIVLALGPPVLAALWFISRIATPPPPPRLGMFYSAVAEFDELPAGDGALDRWVRAYPKMEGGTVKRSGGCLEVEWLSVP
jgi:hypothetical protein